MQIELRFYNPGAGVDDAGVPCEVTHTKVLDLPPAAVPNPCDAWPAEQRAQMMADLLDAMAAAGRVAT